MVGVANRAKRAEELGALAAESPDEPAAYITGLSEGIEICAECLAEEGERKHLMYSKCKAIDRYIPCCNATCQSKAWRKHKAVCGVPHSEVNTSRPQESATPSQLKHLNWIEQHPRAVWGMKGGSSSTSNSNDRLFLLPSFVRPFLPTLKALVALRNKAIKTKDEQALGLLVLYIRKAFKYSTGRPAGQYTDSEDLQQLAKFFELSVGELERFANESEQRIDKADVKISSALEQLASGRASPSHPSQRITDYALLAPGRPPPHPSQILDIQFPTTTETFPLSLPVTLTSHNVVLAKIRALAFAKLNTAGRDDKALGLWMLFCTATGPLNDDSPAMSMGKLLYFMAMEVGLGLPGGTVDSAVSRAARNLEERDDEEGEMLWKALSELHAHRPSMYAILLKTPPAQFPAESPTSRRPR